MASPIQTERHIPPASPVKLIFIHHSVGGNWLAHDYGGLVNELNKNNYYVNDVTYGWEPAELTETLPKKIKLFVLKIQRKILEKLGRTYSGPLLAGAYNIGSSTDIGHMPVWFLGKDSEMVMAAIYSEDLETTNFGDHSNKTSMSALANPDPEIENQIIMFKSCFPNTQLTGNANDQATQSTPPPINFPADSKEHTVTNAKRVFNDLLQYYKEHPDKFFVIVTPPPQTKLPENGKIARGFSNWLVHDWLRENNYPLHNVFVFDLFNVLTSGYGPGKNDLGEKQGNHHRVWKGKIQHVIQINNNKLTYPSKKGDDHPSKPGLQKATKEFVPLMNYHYRLWQANK